MDVITDIVNDQLEIAFPSLSTYLPYDSPLRLYLILYALIATGGALLYFLFAGVSYYVIFHLFPEKLLTEEDKKVKPGQIRKEIKASVEGIPFITIIIAPIFLVERYGYSKLYADINEYGYVYAAFSIVWFLMFTDFCIYWIHRGLHYPPVYKVLHAKHHSFLAPTPWAAIAFHPVDGWCQALPYHLFVFIFPFHKWIYFTMFIFVQLWTISIHDRVSLCGLDGFINGAAHHSGHHLYFKFNYGQYFTLWDRVGGTHLTWDGGKALADKRNNILKKIYETHCATTKLA